MGSGQNGCVYSRNEGNPKSSIKHKKGSTQESNVPMGFTPEVPLTFAKAVVSSKVRKGLRARLQAAEVCASWQHIDGAIVGASLKMVEM
jgi:hypothetical protein